MTRKLKMLGMAFVAVLALTAVSASAASAASYTASTYPTTATGTSPLGNDVFTTEAGKVECASHFEGTLAEASKEITITAKYTNCKAFGFVEAKVSHCKYTFTEPTGSGHTWEAKAVHIVGTPCTIEAGTCKVSVPLQGPLSKVHLVLHTATGVITVKASVEKIKYNVTQDGFGCPFAGTGEKTGATYVQGSAISLAATNGAKLSIS